VRSSITTKSSIILLIGDSKEAVRVIHSHQPKCEIIAVIQDPQTARQLNVLCRVTPLVYEGKLANVSKMDFGINYAKKRGILKNGDTIVMLKSEENLMEIHYIPYKH
jgi:pyruvate kinase